MTMKRLLARLHRGMKIVRANKPVTAANPEGHNQYTGGAGGSKGGGKDDDEDKKRDFIDKFAQKHGSAVDLWGDKDTVDKIHDLHQQGHKFKSVSFDMDSTSEDKVNNRVNALKSQGWKHLATEDNYSSKEVLMHKPGAGSTKASDQSSSDATVTAGGPGSGRRKEGGGGGKRGDAERAADHDEDMRSAKYDYSSPANAQSRTADRASETADRQKDNYRGAESHYNASYHHGEAATMHRDAAEAYRRIPGKDAEKMAAEHESKAEKHDDHSERHFQRSGEIRSAQDDKKYNAKDAARFNEYVTAAHGEVTGKPTMSMLQSKIAQCVQGDPRFDCGKRGYAPTLNGAAADQTYYSAPWCCDVLVPDNDGKMEAVIRDCSGKLCRIGFTWDGDELKLDDGDPTPTESTVVYARRCEEYLAAVKAANPQGNNQYTGGSGGGSSGKKNSDLPGHTKQGEPMEEGTRVRADTRYGGKVGTVKELSGDKSFVIVKHDNGTTRSYHHSDLHSHEDEEEDVDAKSRDQSQSSAVSAANPEGHNQYSKAAAAANKASKDAEKETLKTDEPVEKHLTKEDQYNRRASLHDNAADFHAGAADKHKVAAEEAQKAGDSKAANMHENMYADHRQSMHNHRFAAEHQREWAEKSARKNDAADKSPDFAVRASEAVHCKGSGAAITSSKWTVGEEVEFQYMPGGVSTITAGYNGKSINLTVDCDEDTAKVVQASLNDWKEVYPKQEPFGCVEHREEEAAVHPKSFAWKDDPEPGVYCSAEPTALGARNVNGKIHRSWSPSFTTDAEYSKAKEKHGILSFPDGVRGSRSNPAKITGIAFSVGSLTNKPAFKNILPVKAKQANPQPEQTTSADKTKGLKMQVKFVKARGGNAAGSYGELTGGDLIEALDSGDVLDAVTARRLEAAETKQKNSDLAKIEASLAKAVTRGAILSKGDDAKSLATVKAKMTSRYDAGVDADTICELIDYMPADEDRALLEQRGTANIMDTGTVTASDQGRRRIEMGRMGIRESGKAYLTAREPMDKLIRNGKLKDAHKIAQESGVIMATEIYSLLKKGEDFAIRDLITAAGLDVADPDSQVGTLATGLIIMRNLGYLKSKLGFMPYITTDLRNEPVQFGQTVRTRYITPPAVLTYVPGVGYTRDTTTISNASATTAQDAETTQTSGTRTSSMGAASTKGDTAATANATDVDVKLDQHKGVEIEFSTQKLAGTARNLFAEQQGAQFYSLAEAVNIYFLGKVFGATWTGSVTSMSLGSFSLPKMAAVKNRMTLSRMPDTGRFALLHSYFHDALLADSNLLSAKAILALIHKDESEYNTGEIPPLFGVKPIESQLASFASGTYTAPTIAADGSAVTFGGINSIGFAGNSASMVLVARIPQDYTRALPEIPATAAMEIVTEPDSGLSVLFCKYIDHTLAVVRARCALMYGAAQGDPRQGIVLAP